MDTDVTCCYHSILRCVRRAGLFSEDGSPGRKDWIDLRLKELDRIFVISVGGFSIMNNHLHFLRRIDVDQASQWSAMEVARRWMANKQDGCTGAFFEGLYKSIAILDEEALLSVCAYIDLNPVAAGIVVLPPDLTLANPVAKRGSRTIMLVAKNRKIRRVNLGDSLRPRDSPGGD